MANGLSKEQAQAVVLGIIFLGIAYYTIRIGIIHFYQKLFWISLFICTLSLLFSIISLITGILKKGEHHTYGYIESGFFQKSTFFIVAGGLFILSLSSFLLMAHSYNHGYSNDALERLAYYENQLQSLQQLRDVLTGQIIWDVQNQAIEEIINNSCKDPNYPCSVTKQSYEAYKTIKGAKDDADQIADFFGLIEKNTNERRRRIL